MELSKEFKEAAEKSSEVQEGTYTPQHKVTYIHGFTDGATAYANSVERLLRKKMQELNEKCNNSTDTTKQGWYAAQWNAVEELLTDLEKIKP